VQRRTVVNSYLLTRVDIAQGYEEDMIVGDFHEGIGLTGMIDVVRPVTAPTAVDTPAIVEGTDSQAPAVSAFVSFGVRDQLAGILGNLPPAFKTPCRKATFTFD